MKKIILSAPGRFHTIIFKRSLVFGLTMQFISTVVMSQDIPQQINKLMLGYNRLHQFDGAILVVKKGVVLSKKGYGMANREWNIPNTTDTKFRIASVTKQFTAVLIMQLKQEGKLNLKDPISTFLPWYRTDVGSKVTIYDLLTQSSGIREYSARPDYISDITCHNYSPVDFIKKFCSDSLDFQPGTKYSYSNSNYGILGAIIESVTKQSFEQAVKARIIQSANLLNTGINDPTAVINKMATGYDYEFGKYVVSDYININSACFASGNLYSTVGDLLLWNTALHSGKFLSKANMDTLLLPRFEGYAMGLHLNKITIPGMDHEITLIAHNGNINGFNAIMVYIPELQETLILLRNEGLQSFKADLNTIVIALFNLINKLPYQMPKLSIVSVFADKAVNVSIDNALSFFNSAQVNAKDKYDLSTEEADFNTLGYYLWSHNRLNDALAVFKLNIETFPTSGNAFDSYGEALLQNGQKAAAIQMYKRSVELNPNNENAKNVLLQLAK